MESRPTGCARPLSAAIDAAVRLSPWQTQSDKFQSITDRSIIAVLAKSPAKSITKTVD